MVITIGIFILGLLWAIGGACIIWHTVQHISTELRLSGPIWSKALSVFLGFLYIFIGTAALITGSIVAIGTTIGVLA